MEFLRTDEGSPHVNRVGDALPRPTIPKGVMLLAVACFLTAGTLVLVGSLFAVAPATLRSSGFRQNPGAWVRLSGLGFFGATGALAGVAGYGLWRLKRWAHLILMLSALNLLIQGVLGFLRSRVGVFAPSARWNVGSFVLALAVFGYLWLPGVRAAFEVPAKKSWWR
jgi:hypothetical protein